ncbi:MAG: gamma-glutamylcyclotransferase [Candidatus Hydrogenedentes bacterium]|nr:gamma-glutamylcyclotransferase [Candidatus Hydrogenedentota bacterium]
MNHLVFAYGTLLISGVQEAVLGRAIPGRPDRLRGYRKTTLQDGTDSFPNLAPEADGRVDGRVIEVTQDELNRIDMYEGDLYARHRVTLESGTEAWVYYS